MIGEAIAETLSYAKRFDCQLSPTSVRERLLGPQIYSNQLLSIAMKDTLLNNQSRNGFYEKKMKKARKLAFDLATQIKPILFIGVTGSVAAGYPKENDDIDLLIITRRDQLWISRMMVKIYFWRHQIPQRKLLSAEKKDEFCLNLWLDENRLRLPENKQSLQNAVDLVLMKPLLDKENAYGRFIRINDWVKKLAATPYHAISKNLNSINDDRQKKTGPLLIRLANKVVFLAQYIYMYPKIKGGYIDLNCAFFHPKNR